MTHHPSIIRGEWERVPLHCVGILESKNKTDNSGLPHDTIDNSNPFVFGGHLRLDVVRRRMQSYAYLIVAEPIERDLNVDEALVDLRWLSEC